MSIPSVHGRAPGPPLSVLIREWWFLWPLGLRVLAWIFLAHSYEIAVFQDASWQMLAGQGVYARFSPWLSAAGDGYYAAPPLYAYMLWVSGRVAAVLGGHWWLHQLLIKGWLLLADLAVMAYFLRRSPAAARSYWTMLFVPVVAIGQVQPDLWIGLCVLAALHLALQERWIGVGLLLGLGAGFKPVPLLILPFLAAYLIRAGRRKAVAQVSLALVAALVLGWIPYVLAFPDTREFAEVLRFHATRPIAGLTIPSGILLIANAGLAALQLVGIQLSWAEAAYGAVVRAGVAYPVVTLGVFAALLGVAARGQPWSLPQTFCLPMLAFLAANKVVHEHYILQVLPLLVALGLNLRGTAIAFSVYLLAAGGPLRFFPSELGLPSTVEVLLPPRPGVIASIGLATVSGMAALAFGGQILRLLTTALVERP